MKRLMIAVLAALAFAACQKTEDIAPEDIPSYIPVKGVDKDFIGTVSVDYLGITYDNKDITVTVKLSEDGSMAYLLLNRIKFVPLMPVRVDTIIPATVVGEDGDSLLLEADNLYPISRYGENQTKYTIYGMTGTLSEDKLSFSLKYGTYPTRFNGSLVK
ncbi:MAG: hypothetical protein IJV32_04310 [Bacteroidales bacterium]|nr:hypothetical protein [Bacteroidales bacterium]